MRTELRTAMRRQVTADFMESGSSKAGMLALEARAYHEYQLSEQDRLRLWLVQPVFSHAVATSAAGDEGAAAGGQNGGAA